MGWLWASTRPSTDSKDVKSPTSEQTKSPSGAKPPQASHADSDNDPELDKFLELIRAELDPKSAAPPRGRTVDFTPDAVPPAQPTQPKPSTTLASWLRFRSAAQETPTSTPSSPQSTSPSTTSSAAASSEARPNTTTDTYTDEESPAESQYPRSMSCRQAFDYAFACNGIGGQWNAVYRYGTVRNCSELWGDFWFCMRTRSYRDEEEKARAIRDYYREKERRKYYVPGAKSSEDVWEARKVKVRPGEAFAEQVEARAVPEGMTDDEWRASEIERRRRIRREYGIEDT